MPLAGFVVVFAVAFAVNRNLLMQSSAALLCVIMAALMVTGIQTMGIVQQMSIERFEPRKSIRGRCRCSASTWSSSR